MPSGEADCTAPTGAVDCFSLYDANPPPRATLTFAEDRCSVLHFGALTDDFEKKLSDMGREQLRIQEAQSEAGCIRQIKRAVKFMLRQVHTDTQAPQRQHMYNI